MIAKKLESPEAGRIGLIEEEMPAPGPDEALLQALYSTISPGTELAWLNHMENTPGIYPYTPGYSACCKVLEIGSNVTNIAVGDTVCVHMRHRSYAIVPAMKCNVVPEGIDPKEASAFRLASISLQGVRKADIEIGDQVAVIGLGAIGNYAAQLSHVAGAARVSCFDFVDWRRDLAKECGLTHVEANCDGEEYESKFDVVFEATGVPSVINTALRMVKPLGRVILLGSTRGLTDGVNFYRDVHRKGVTVVGAHEVHRAKDVEDRFGHFRSNKEDEAVILNLLQEKRISLEPLISELVNPENAQSIYDRLLDRKEKLLLATFDWTI